jgi:hypothetical protein
MKKMISLMVMVVLIWGAVLNSSWVHSEPGGYFFTQTPQPVVQIDQDPNRIFNLIVKLRQKLIIERGKDTGEKNDWDFKRWRWKKRK